MVELNIIHIKSFRQKLIFYCGDIFLLSYSLCNLIETGGVSQHYAADYMIAVQDNLFIGLFIYNNPGLMFIIRVYISG